MQNYIAIRIPGKTSEAVMAAMSALHNVEGSLGGCCVYFARPYTSWQRPQNGRHNGLFRAIVPQGASIKQYSDEDILSAADELNGHPRKKLGYTTP